MNLEDFETLELAKVAPLVIDKKQVGSGQARGWMSGNSVWLQLRRAQSNKDSALFSLADAIIITASDAKSFFGLDPLKNDGLGNLFALNRLVSERILTATQRDQFLVMSLVTTYPLAHKTDHEFKIAKGSCEQVAVTAIDGHVTINVSADCALHNPRLMAKNPRTNKMARINNFRGVSEAGLYDCSVPAVNRGWALSVDDAYGVVS